MNLSESEIVRYSRQILLREVGGKGQLKLMSSAWKFSTDDEPLQIAAAYLIASGVTALNAKNSHMKQGFLTDTDFSELNADLRESPNVVGEIGVLGLDYSPPKSGAFVVLASNGLAFSPGPLETADFNKLVLPLTVGAVPNELEVTLASSIALVAQRLILGLESTPGTLVWTGLRLLMNPFPAAIKPE